MLGLFSRSYRWYVVVIGVVGYVAYGFVVLPYGLICSCLLILLLFGLYC